MSSTIRSISKLALGPRGDPGRLADLALDEGDQLGERGPVPGADVEDGGRVVATEQVGDHPGDVSGVEVVADRGAVAVEDDLLAAFDVMEEGDDRALAPVGLLVLAVEGRAAQDPRPEAGLLTRPADRLLAGEMELSVERAGMGRGVLGDRHPVGLPVHGSSR